MHPSITYVEVGASTPMTTWAGFGRNNIALYNGLAIGNVDAVEAEGDSFDGCYAHASPNNNAQHAHTISPCVNGQGITGSKTNKPGACNQLNCWGNMRTMMSGWTSTNGNYGGVYGLARDGHVIFGPYNSDGELWGCEDVDLCNGFFLSDGSYGYASTTFFPYMVGCWGPAPTG